MPAGQFWREKAGSSGRGTQVARKAQIPTHQDQRVYLGPMGSWPSRRLTGEVQQTGKLAGCDGRNGQPAPEYFNPALSDGGTLTGIISGLPAYRGCCPATVGAGSLPPRTYQPTAHPRAIPST